MIIVFDTETNGKPINYNAPMRDLNNWPRVIQLAWAMYDTEGNQLAKRCDLIHPDGWEIPVADFWIKHGYSTAKNAAEGIPMAEALAAFADRASECDVLVAHNLQFDYNILGAEMLRYGIYVGKKLDQYCTMRNGTEVCKLPGFKGEYKWPSLTELHTKLLGCSFDGAHDALADVEACAACYFAMKK